MNRKRDFDEIVNDGRSVGFPGKGKRKYKVGPQRTLEILDNERTTVTCIDKNHCERFAHDFDVGRVDARIDSCVSTSRPGKWLGMQSMPFPRRDNTSQDSSRGGHRAPNQVVTDLPPQSTARRTLSLGQSHTDLPPQSTARRSLSLPELQLIPNSTPSVPLFLSCKSQMVAPLTQTCKKCRRVAPYLCRRCQQIAYCSLKCQRAHFPNHRHQFVELTQGPSPPPSSPKDVLRPVRSPSVNLSNAVAGLIGLLEKDDSVYAQQARHLCQAAANGDEIEVTRLLKEAQGDIYMNAEVKMDDPELCAQQPLIGTSSPTSPTSPSFPIQPDSIAIADSKEQTLRPALCTPLIAASIKGHVPVLRRVLAAGAYPNQSDPKTGLTALMLAQLPAAVDTLLAAKANPHLKAKRSGKTALMFAAERGSAAVIEKLSTAGAVLNWRELKGGCTAIRLAAQRGNWEAVKKLIDLRADPNRSDKDGVLPLMVAAFKGDYQVVKQLMRASPDINHAAVDGLTSLMYAVRGGSTAGHSDCLTMLIEARAALDCQDVLDGLTALMSAARSGNADAVSRLLKAGADTQLKNLKGLTAFDLAHNQGHANIAEMLKAHSLMNPKQRRSKRKHDRARRKREAREAARATQAAEEAKASGGVPATPAELEDITEKDKQGKQAQGDHPAELPAGQTMHDEEEPIHGENVVRKMIEAVWNQDNATLAKILNELPEEHMLGWLDQDGNHPLLEAAILGGPSSLSASIRLLEAGTCVDVSNKDGSTALMHAACAGNDEIIQLLLAARADMNLQDRSGFCALQHAALNGREWAVNQLIVAKADLDIQDNYGFSALKAAALHGRDRIVARLLEANADLSLDKTNGPTVLQCASNPTVFKLLKTAQANQALINAALKSQTAPLSINTQPQTTQGEQASQTGNVGEAHRSKSSPSINLVARTLEAAKTTPIIITQTQQTLEEEPKASVSPSRRMQELELQWLQIPYVSTPLLASHRLLTENDNSTLVDAEQEEGSESGHGGRDSSEDSIRVLGDSQGGQDGQDDPSTRTDPPGHVTPTPKDGASSRDWSESERKG
eukprot:g76102.t1